MVQLVGACGFDFCGRATYLDFKFNPSSGGQSSMRGNQPMCLAHIDVSLFLPSLDEGFFLRKNLSKDAHTEYSAVWHSCVAGWQAPHSGLGCMGASLHSHSSADNPEQTTSVSFPKVSVYSSFTLDSDPSHSVLHQTGAVKLDNGTQSTPVAWSLAGQPAKLREPPGQLALRSESLILFLAASVFPSTH